MRHILCARCDKERPHKSRGLCKPCYNTTLKWGQHDNYRLNRDPSMDVDEVAVQRSIEWVQWVYASVRSDERSGRPDRPRLNKGEKMEVLRRTAGKVPKTAVIEALHIGSADAQRAREEVGAW